VKCTPSHIESRLQLSNNSESSGSGPVAGPSYGRCHC